MDDTNVLLKCSLFADISLHDINNIIYDHCCMFKEYKKGQIVLMAGQRPENVGIVISGNLVAQKNSENGQGFTVTSIKPCHVFGDILAGSNNVSPVTITALSDCKIMLLPFTSLLNTSSDKAYCRQLLRNLTSTVADKYFALDKRINLLLEKNLRMRILGYLKEKATQKGSFSHKMTRQQMADYLGCDRAALCRELSRMKRDSLIEYDKHSFTVF